MAMTTAASSFSSRRRHQCCCPSPDWEDEDVGGRLECVSLSQRINDEQSQHVIVMTNTTSDINATSSLHSHDHRSSKTVIDLHRKKRDNNRFQTLLALRLTTCSLVMLLFLAACFSDWSVQDYHSYSASPANNMEVDRSYSHHQNYHKSSHNYYLDRGDEFVELLSDRRSGVKSRFLDNINYNNYVYDNNQEAAAAVSNNDNTSSNENGGDYSSDRCDEIFTKTTSAKSNNAEPSQRCLYARTCDNGDGLLLPFVFCHTSIFSTTAWLVLLSPILLLGLAVLFRLLGSTAEEYFSPSLEMFSVKLGLPPRFAGVTLLALGNGAADVSATINAIASDPENGYKMSLGALTGAAMFITTVVAGAVIMANDGLTCRGALVRDVMALGTTTLVVSLSLRKGEVGKSTESTFVGIYILFVLIVLVADVYHRAVMLPRLSKQAEMVEQQRQVDAERVASIRAGDVLNVSASSETMDASGGRRDRSHDPSEFEDLGDCRGSSGSALTAVLTALSNYSKDEHAIEGFDIDPQRSDGWGVESSVEGTRSWDRPIVLRGANGILTRQPHHNTAEDGTSNEGNFDSPYRIMEDLDIVENVCISKGSTGFAAHNWSGALHDVKQELFVHFRDCWMDILNDDDISRLEKLLLICEFPMTVCRKLTVSIPCEGSYCRALVALSLAISPLWVGFYAWNNFHVNLWGWQIYVFLAVTLPMGLMIIRYAPGGEGTLATFLAVPIALYGFVIAATWIDAVADKLVALLEFLGVTLRIPNSIMGLTILAWGNSMADLSANVTMARKGLANMAITACFAGPVFNILIGLGAGFGVLGRIRKTDVNYVSLTPEITTGFVFCLANCILILFSGLAVNKGVIPAGYGYLAFGLYALYVVTSLVLNFTVGSSI